MNINEEVIFRASTITHDKNEVSYNSSSRKIGGVNPMAMTQGVRFSFRGDAAAITPNSFAQVNQSLYSESHQLSQFGKQIYERLRAETDQKIESDPTKTMSGRLHFGSIGKYSGMRETPRAIGFTLKD